jgi:hypothetical protein
MLVVADTSRDGTVGVLEQAAIQRLVDLPEVLARLLTTNFRILPSIITEVLARVMPSVRAIRVSARKERKHSTHFSTVRFPLSLLQIISGTRDITGEFSLLLPVDGLVIDRAVS